MPTPPPLHVALIATYELGRQPFGLASPAAWLRQAGHRVACYDLSRQPLQVQEVAAVDLVAFHLPMHTASRLARRAAAKLRAVRADLPLCFFGLYAPLNAASLFAIGGEVTCLGGEFEAGLLALVEGMADSNGPGATDLPLVSRERLDFRTPDRDGLPALSAYAGLRLPGGELRTAGYTEASRGCKHRCRHCPVVPVYDGRFRIVPAEVVLDDIRQQVASGARHITFGDPDFFNGIGHALEVVAAMHREHPDLTFDATIKVSHLLDHTPHLDALRESGCLFVTTAVESTEEEVLRRLGKGHSGADFPRVVALCRQAGVGLSPTFVPFTPWTTLEGYLDLLERVACLDLVGSVAPVQYTLRLLIAAGSRLLELEEARAVAGPFDDDALVHPWRHSDPSVDALQEKLAAVVALGNRSGLSRGELVQRIWRFAHEAAGRPVPPLPAPGDGAPAAAAIPYLQEPWYC